MVSRNGDGTTRVRLWFKNRDQRGVEADVDLRGPQPPETPTPPTEPTGDAATADAATDVTTERPAEVTGSADDRQMRDKLGELLGGDADLLADAQARLNAPNAGEYEKQAARAVLRYRQRDGRDGVTPYETTEGDESQPLFRLRGEEKKHVERNNKRFNEELDRQIAGQLLQGHIYNLGRAGSILQSAGFPDADIELSATRLAEKARQHGFGIDDVRNLVSALQEPVAVFSYGDKAKAQNVIAEIVRDGKNFVVGVHFNQVRGNTEVSSIRGLFPKDNAEWLNWVSQGKLLKEKIQTLIDQQRTNPAEVDYLDLEDVAKIIKDFENPSVPGENNGKTTESGGISQGFGSAATSLNQVASAMRKIDWKPGTVNVDIGGGRFDKATEYLREQGVESMVFDPFNRDAEHNRQVAERVRDEKVDTATCNNVLNVIDSASSRANVILQAALYNPDIYGQNQKTTKPHNWVVINTKDKAGKNRLVLLEVNQNKDNVEIVHWHYIRDNALETLKRQAEREGGRILILPSDSSEEGGDLSARTHGLPSGNKDSDNVSTDQTNVAKTTESGGALFRVRRAPNGEESNLDERQYDEVRTGNFKKWFGDWENNPEEASKVVDKNGEPLVVYHQTNRKQYINQLTACVCGCVMVLVADPLTTRQTTRLLWRRHGGGWRARMHRSLRSRLRGLSSKPTVAARVTRPVVADANPDKDIPDHIPEDGYYLKATNADKVKSQADRVGWFVSGAFKANRVISDAEARRVIDQWNAEHPDQKVEYDYEREGGVEFSEEDAARVNGGEKATTIERGDAVSGNPSDGGLRQGGSEHLSHNPLTHQEDAAKIQRNTDITLRAARKIQNEGGLKKQIATATQAVSAIGKGLHLDKSDSSQSYYGDVYEGDIMVDGRLLHLRVSDHEANGARIGNADADHKVSLVIRKNGEHVSTGEHNGYTEWVFEPSEVSPKDAANAIIGGVESLIRTGEFVDATGKAHRKNYPYTDNNGVVHYRVRRAPNGKESNLDERQYDEVRKGNFKKWFGDWENNPEEASKVVDANGEPLVGYHQTNRKQYINQLTACVCGCVMVPVADPLTTRQTTRLLWRRHGGGWRATMRRSLRSRLRGLSSRRMVVVMRRTRPMVAAGQRINSNSRYLGRGHISSSTINSSLST